MSLIRADKDSNAAGGATSVSPENEGDAAMCGYTKYEADGDAATSNEEIKSTKDTVGAGNDGTNMDSYQYQTRELNSKSGMKVRD